MAADGLLNVLVLRLFAVGGLVFGWLGQGREGGDGREEDGCVPCVWRYPGNQ